MPVRVSRMRAGTSGWKRPALPVPVPEYQPATSATTWVLPAGLKKLTLPLAPTFTTTRFDTVWFGTKLRLLARGRSMPEG